MLRDERKPAGYEQLAPEAAGHSSPASTRNLVVGDRLRGIKRTLGTAQQRAVKSIMPCGEKMHYLPIGGPKAREQGKHL